MWNRYGALLLVCACCGFSKAQSIAVDATRSGHWTKAEQQEFQGCVVRTSEQQKTSGKVPGSPASWCEVWEEHQHFMHLHPRLAKRKEIPGRFSQCNKQHAAEVNGTPQQFYVAFDQCMREAYGLPVASK